ncbi:MAG: NAD-dependent SIR2 family protein deacetylase [Alcanivorax sp.]|jgi:NAD-dependent SIR2 family protein deacetylase
MPNLVNTLAKDLVELQTFLKNHPRLVLLTGAGISAGSGIPTYRDAAGVWRVSEPIKHQEFITDSTKRQRYWARSLRGWPAVHDAKPNEAHLALATLERGGHVEMLITQNVDRLHQRAGSAQVVDLHGRLDQVVCLNCNGEFSRESIQQTLTRENPGASAGPLQIRPDGDSDVRQQIVDNFRVPACTECNGVLMPDVVFFGGTVPRDRVEKCMRAIDRSDALLVIGSSLKVYSGFRFCKRAAAINKPIALINSGATRADSIATLRLSSECGPLLSALLSPR